MENLTLPSSQAQGKWIAWFCSADPLAVHTVIHFPLHLELHPIWAFLLPLHFCTCVYSISLYWHEQIIKNIHQSACQNNVTGQNTGTHLPVLMMIALYQLKLHTMKLYAEVIGMEKGTSGQPFLKRKLPKKKKKKTTRAFVLLRHEWDNRANTHLRISGGKFRRLIHFSTS